MASRTIHSLSLLLLLLSSTALLVHGAKKQKEVKIERKELIEKYVPGVDGPDERGQYHIEHEGMKWAVLESKHDDGAPMIIFISTKGFSIAYADPRTNEVIELPEEVKEAGRVAQAAAPPPPPIKDRDDLAAGLPADAEMDEDRQWFITDNFGVKYVLAKDEKNKRWYFNNQKTGVSSWSDPRKDQPEPEDTEEDPYEDPEKEEL